MCRFHAALPVLDNRILVSGGCSAIGALQDVHIFNTGECRSPSLSSFVPVVFMYASIKLRYGLWSSLFNKKDNKLLCFLFRYWCVEFTGISTALLQASCWAQRDKLKQCHPNRRWETRTGWKHKYPVHFAGVWWVRLLRFLLQWHSQVHCRDSWWQVSIFKRERMAWCELIWQRSIFLCIIIHPATRWGVCCEQRSLRFCTLHNKSLICGFYTLFPLPVVYMSVWIWGLSAGLGKVRLI